MSDSLIDTTDIEAKEVTQETDSREVIETSRVAGVSRPEGIPDAFWNTEANSLNTDALLEGYKSEAKQKADMRAIISKGLGKPAESITEFDSLVINEDMQKYLGEDNQSLSIAKDAAFEAGIPVDKMTDFINKYLSKGGEKGLFPEIQPRLSPEEQEVLNKASDDKFKEEQMAILGDEGKRSLAMIKHEIKILADKGSLNKEDIEAFENAAFDAKGVNFMAKLINKYKGAQIIPTEHVIDKGTPTMDELHAMGKDPRMDSDPAFRAKRTAGFQYYEKIGVI